MACALPDTTYGLECLLNLEEAFVKQKKTLVHEYVVSNSDGQVLLVAKEDSTTMGVLFSAGKDRKFIIHVLDANEKELFWVRRPFTWGPDKMEVVLANGHLISMIRQKQTFLKAVLYVNNAQDEIVLKIKSEGMISQMENVFNVYGTNGQVIGTITKTWAGCARELFSYADNFVIKFPLNLDVRYKAALISACFLIDFLFFEGKK